MCLTVYSFFNLCLVGMYKLVSYSSFVFFLFVIAGCVSIPPKTHLVNASGFINNYPLSSECSVEKIQHSLSHFDEPTLQLDPNNISVLNWNIYKANRDNWPDDFKKFIEAQDLLILQEAITSPKVIKLLNKQHSNWRLNAAFHSDDYGVGVLTASTIKPVFSCGIRTTEPVIRIPKTVLINLYPLAYSNEKLLVANLHGINFTLGTEVYAQQIHSMMSIIEQHSGPVIVAGDFNTWSQQRMNIVSDMADTLSLKAVEYKAHNRITVFGYALDHVYYRGLEVTREQTHKVSSSDHNPIGVNFRMLGAVNMALTINKK